MGRGVVVSHLVGHGGVEAVTEVKENTVSIRAARHVPLTIRGAATTTRRASGQRRPVVVLEFEDDDALGHRAAADTDLGLVAVELEGVVVGQQLHRTCEGLPAAGIVLDRARILKRNVRRLVDQRVRQ